MKKVVTLSLLIACFFITPVFAQNTQYHPVMDKERLIQILTDKKYYKKGDKFIVCNYEHMDESIFCTPAIYVNLIKIKKYKSSEFYYSLTVHHIDDNGNIIQRDVTVGLDDVISIN